jgi:hypothetical protein
VTLTRTAGAKSRRPAARQRLELTDLDGAEARAELDAEDWVVLDVGVPSPPVEPESAAVALGAGDDNDAASEGVGVGTVASAMVDEVASAIVDEVAAVSAAIGNNSDGDETAREK